MRGGIAGFTTLIILIVVLFIGWSSTFTVHQTEQALVLRFGEPVAGYGVVTTPGLHFKAPFIDTVVLLDNRILNLENPNQMVNDTNNNPIEVDAFAKYRIIDPLKFYQSVHTVEGASSQLGSELNAALRGVLGGASIPQIVKEKREELMARIRDQVDGKGATMGVSVVDVRIRRADLPREISASVYNLMKTEREQAAANFRAQGAQESQRIKSQADRDATILVANAQQQADQIRGDGDAERNRIFAEAFGKDPDFFAFYRSMQAYDASLQPNGTSLVLSPTADFFRYFNNAAGAPANPPAPGSAPANAPAGAAPSPPAPGGSAATPPPGAPAPGPSRVD
ncbi:MAG: protease modulator HflC [Methylobacteriaceae bacterium]|nr:protease modulator HflC [Methylobacteriaceae bacterium]